VSVSRTVSDIFSVKLWRDLETWVRGHSRSFKRILPVFESLGAVSYRRLTSKLYNFDELLFEADRKLFARSEDLHHMLPPIVVRFFRLHCDLGDTTMMSPE